MRLWWVSFTIIFTAFVGVVMIVGPLYAYNPFFRISLLVVVSFLYIWFELSRKKYLLKKGLFSEENDTAESVAEHNDPHETYAFILRILYIGMILNGGIVLYYDYLSVMSFPQLDAPVDLLPVAFLLAVILGSLLLWWIYRHFEGTVHLYAILEETLIFGLLGIVLTSWVAAKEINIYCDRTQTLLVPSHALSKEYHKSGKSISFYLTLSGWNSSREKMLRVNAATYQEIPEGSHLLVYTHKGFFGFPWIEKIAVDPQQATEQSL